MQGLKRIRPGTMKNALLFYDDYVEIGVRVRGKIEWAKFDYPDLCFLLSLNRTVTVKIVTRNKVYCALKFLKENKTLHRLLMNCPSALTVDHINGDSLDNRRSNLRIVTRQENCRNLQYRKFATNKYRGVCFHNGRYRARLKDLGVHMHLGIYDTPEEAAEAYNRKAIEVGRLPHTLNRIVKNGTQED